MQPSELQEDFDGPAQGPPESYVNQQAIAKLRESNARITSRIREAQALSEREILACGEVLSSIVDKARQLADESNHAMTSAMARTESVTGRFVLEMREDIAAQENAVCNVLELANTIEEAIGAINDLTLASKVLAINARIEAARLGLQGKGFAVIADNLSGLSKVIGDASDKVVLAVSHVRQGLPSVKAHAQSMGVRTTAFIDAMSEQVRSVSMQNEKGESNNRLAVLMELSNKALSHLQFQDPMAQKLNSVNDELNASHDRLRAALSGAEPADEGELDVPTVSDAPASGDIMLF